MHHPFHLLEGQSKALEYAGAATALAVTLMLSGCSAPAEVDEPFAKSEAELGEATCARDPVATDLVLRADGASQLTPNFGPAATGVIGDARRTPTTYNDRTCFMAAKIRIDGGVGPTTPIIIGGVRHDPVHIWVAPSSLPSNPTDCNATTARAILYAHSFVTGTEVSFAVSELRARASWNTVLNVCNIQWMDLGHPEGGSGVPYHVAVTARTNDVTRAVDVVATTQLLQPDDRALCGRLGNCVRTR
jgi:hypothetical protein